MTPIPVTHPLYAQVGYPDRLQGPAVPGRRPGGLGAGIAAGTTLTDFRSA